MILVGDLNIAPLEHDVWSHKQLLKIVSHTPIEVEKLTAMQNSIGWVDAMRHFVPADEKLYTWWSYRNNDWRASNRAAAGWTISGSRRRWQKAFKGMQIAQETRDWAPPSDHVPVIVDLD